MPRVLVQSDNFNRASLDSNWTNQNTGAAGNVLIDSSTRATGQFSAQATDQLAAARWTGAGAFTADQYSVLRLTNVTSGGGVITRAGVTVRSSGSGTARAYYEAVVQQTFTTSMLTELAVWVSGVGRTVLHSASLVWANGDLLELEVEGTTLRVLRNGVPLGGGFTRTDATLTSGVPGITITGSAFGDDWEGGNITASSTPPVVSAPTRSDTATTAVGGFTTDGADGNARAVWIAGATQPAAPSAVQVLAGQNSAGSSVPASAVLPITSPGAKTLGAATVTTQVTHWGFAAHINAANSASNVLALGAVYPGTGRPVSDVAAGGWTPSAGGVLAAMLLEDSAIADATKDTTFITSPALSSTPVVCRLQLNKPYTAGTYSGVRCRMWTQSGTATARIRFVNDAGASMGVTANQTITTTPTTYTLPVTLTGTATRVEIEVQV